MTRKETIIVLLLALLNFTHILDFMIMMPLGNILMPQWKMDTSQFSQVVSAYPITAFVISFAAIFFADKFDRKKLLLFAYTGFLITTFFCSQATGYFSMMLARVGTGLFGGLIGAQVMSIVGDIIPYERRGRAMALLMGGFALASVVGVPLSLFLANHYHWYYPFILVAACGVVLFPFLFIFIPNVNAHLQNPMKLHERFENFLHIFQNRTQIIALLFSSLLMLGHFLIIPLINPYMVKNVGLDAKQTPYIYLVGGLSSILTSSIAGKLADKYGKNKIFIIAASMSLLFVFIITNMPQLPIYIVLSVFALWFMTATARSIPGQAMITQSVTLKTRGSFMSFNSCVQQLGTGLASLTSGWMTYSDAEYKIHGYANLGYMSIAVIIICIYLSRILERRLLAIA